MPSIHKQSAHKIINGPSREELFDALRLFDNRRSVVFTLRDVNTEEIFELQCWVQGIELEDGSGHSWIVKLDALSANKAITVDADCSPIYIYYHDTHRKGHVTHLGHKEFQVL